MIQACIGLPQILGKCPIYYHCQLDDKNLCSTTKHVAVTICPLPQGLRSLNRCCLMPARCAENPHLEVPKIHGRCFPQLDRNLHVFWKKYSSIVSLDKKKHNFPEITRLLGSKTVPYLRKLPGSGKPWWLRWPPQRFTQAQARQGIHEKYVKHVKCCILGCLWTSQA